VKRTAILISVLALPLVLSSCAHTTPEKARKTELNTYSEKIMYIFGQDIGNRLKNMDTAIDLDTLVQGIEDALHDKEPLITKKEANQVKKEFSESMQRKNIQVQTARAKKNLMEGEAFLEENGIKQGIITTESGLQYRVLSEGNGPKPKENDQVRINYTGTLIDGTEFDSSYKRGKPVTFNLKGVIRGWEEALQLMPVGSTYRLFIPSNLAYGERGAGQVIGPNATLIFEVELLEIVE
jgi:FKBP-type peptidyl-prolyl cis-trans isomerase